MYSEKAATLAFSLAEGSHSKELSFVLVFAGRQSPGRGSSGGPHGGAPAAAPTRGGPAAAGIELSMRLSNFTVPGEGV